MYLHILLLVLFTTTISLATPHYTNCEFRTDKYHDVCVDANAQGVSIQYINEFLVSDKAKERDLRSFELFNPKKISLHHTNERRANNALVKYVPTIVSHLKTHRDAYDLAEKKYRVNREIVAAILMKETRLGKIRPKHDAFVVFNTLLLGTRPLSQRDRWLIRMAKANMVHIIRHCYHDKVTPDNCDLASSYAGAVGIPQFMPMNFHHIEGYENAQGDLWDMNDAIVSTSRFLHYNAQFTSMMAWERLPDMAETETAWYDFDFKHKDASFGHCCNKKGDKKYACFACDRLEFDYLRKYTKKIMRYNNSSNYAIGVIRLAYDAHHTLVKDKTP